MKLISLSKLPYFISITAHLLALVAFGWVALGPRQPARTFQAAVYFEEEKDQRPTISRRQKRRTSETLPKLPLVRNQSKSGSSAERPSISSESTSLPTPSLKKYITKPKAKPFHPDDSHGYLRANKRTEKPALPLISNNRLKKSKTRQSGSQKPGSVNNTEGQSRKEPAIVDAPLVPGPDFNDRALSDQTGPSSQVAKIWQKKSELMVYRNTLARLVTANWVVPPTSVKGFQIIIEAHIGPRGNVINLKPLKSSGLAVLDAAAERAIRVSAPFPEFPDTFDKNQTVYRAVFRFTPEKVAN